MTAVRFLVEWAARSSILIGSGALVIWAARVKGPAVRLACWTALLCGSLAIPVLMVAVPRVPLPKVPAPVLRPTAAQPPNFAASPAPPSAVLADSENSAEPFDWTRAAAAIYALVAGALLLRLGAGLAMGRLLLSRSRATGCETEGIEIRESGRLTAPAALGILRPAIVLPADWREWEADKLEAVLAHERSHIRRADPAVQLLSAVHRALVWHSPLSWLLDRRIVRLAEEASDDAAVAAVRDRASYAEILLHFIQRGMRGTGVPGVAMARYGRPEERIHRILDGAGLSRGVTRWSVAAIVAVACPLAYLAAAASALQPETPAIVTVNSITEQAPAAAAVADAAQERQPAAAPRPSDIRRYMIFDGDSTSGSWDSRDPVDEEGLRAKFGHRLAWFRRNGNEYVITDAGVLDELRQAMEPQKEVNRLQAEVNKRQSVVNSHQADVNRAQSGVNALQQQVNRRQDILNRLQSAQGDADLIQKLEAALAELKARKEPGVDQSTVNREQAKVNEMQSKVNSEQAEVNRQQSGVNDAQQRVSAEFNRRIQEIFESAIQRRLVQQLK